MLVFVMKITKLFLITLTKIKSSIGITGDSVVVRLP